jgi:hypothetical protein
MNRASAQYGLSPAGSAGLGAGFGAALGAGVSGAGVDGAAAGGGVAGFSTVGLGATGSLGSATVTGFGLAVPPQSTLPPALNSEHIAGNAVDMDITWEGTIKVKDKKNKEVEVSFMRDANANGGLHSLGESYGVKKLKNDAPHWSSSGR